MIIVTTPSLEGRRITQYVGLVSGDAILGANIFRDLFASIRDIVGGRSAAYEQELRKAKSIALDVMRDPRRNDEFGASSQLDAAARVVFPDKA